MNGLINFKESEKHEFYSNWRHLILAECEKVIEEAQNLLHSLKYFKKSDFGLEMKSYQLLKELKLLLHKITSNIPRSAETTRLFIKLEKFEAQITYYENLSFSSEVSNVKRNEKIFEEMIDPLRREFQTFMKILELFDKEVNTALRS